MRKNFYDVDTFFILGGLESVVADKLSLLFVTLLLRVIDLRNICAYHFFLYFCKKYRIKGN